MQDPPAFRSTAQVVNNGIVPVVTTTEVSTDNTNVQSFNNSITPVELKDIKPVPSDFHARGYRGNNQHNMYNRGRGRARVFRNDGYPSYGPAPIPYIPQFQPPTDPEAIKDALIKQIEYYFTDENLVKDIYLRKHMNDEGWVPLSLIANFPRVKGLCADTETIIEILKAKSTVLEVQSDQLRTIGGSTKKWSMQRVSDSSTQ